MAGQVRITTIVEVWDPVRGYYKWPTYKKTIGSLTAIEDRTYSIASAATRNLWDPDQVDTEAVSDFDLMIAVSNGNLDMELDIDQNGTVGREEDSIRIVKDLPLLLGSDVAYANHSAGDAFGGTLDTIDRIRAKEPDSSAKNLRMLLATTA